MFIYWRIWEQGYLVLRFSDLYKTLLVFLMMHLRCIFHGNNNLIRMPLRKVFVDKEGDDDKKSINDALSWFLQKFTLIHFPGVRELQLLSNTINRSLVWPNFWCSVAYSTKPTTRPKTNKQTIKKVFKSCGQLSKSCQKLSVILENKVA